MKIIDVSQYQGLIDWDKVSSSLGFAIIRASCGMNEDTRYHKNTIECDRLNIPYHAYHYIKATTLEEADKEAEIFALATCGTNPLFYVIDVEYSGLPLGKEKAIVEEFEDELRRQLGDVRIAAYIAHHKYSSYKLDNSRYAYIWIPRYGANTGEPDKAPVYACDLWQYTSVGRIDGIKGNVDLSTLHGDKTLDYFITPNVDVIEYDEGGEESAHEGQGKFSSKSEKEPGIIFYVIKELVKWIRSIIRKNKTH